MFPGAPSVVVVPRPWPNRGDRSQAGISIFHFLRRQRSELFGSPVVLMLVDDSRATRRAPRGVAKNAKTTAAAIRKGPSLTRKEPGFSAPNSTSIALRVISPSMLKVATRAAAKSATKSASERRRPAWRYSHSEATAAIAKNIAALSGWANVPYERLAPVNVAN